MWWTGWVGGWLSFSQSARRYGYAPAGFGLGPLGRISQGSDEMDILRQLMDLCADKNSDSDKNHHWKVELHYEKFRVVEGEPQVELFRVSVRDGDDLLATGVGPDIQDAAAVASAALAVSGHLTRE